MKSLEGGRRQDNKFNIVFPWYTHPALDEIDSWDVVDKVVLEFGGGDSTIWWTKRGAFVYVVETDPKWCDYIRKNCDSNRTLIWQRDKDDIEISPALLGLKPDIVVIDGPARASCLRYAVSLPRPITIIFDNWQQDFVFVDEELERFMEPYRDFGRFFTQPDHTNHAGRPWQTAIWQLS